MGALLKRGADGGISVSAEGCRGLDGLEALSLGEWKRRGEPPLNVRGGLRGRAGVRIPGGVEEWGRLGRPERRLGEWTLLVIMRARDTCSYCCCHHLRPKGTGERNRS